MFVATRTKMEMQLMDIAKKSLTILEFKRLLIELKEKRPDICIRYRLIGEMWMDNFTKIRSVVGNSLFVEYERIGMTIHVQNIGNVIQFEIDQNFQQYVAHFHYEVVLDQ
jgi:hypothetical protein